MYPVYFKVSWIRSTYKAGRCAWLQVGSRELGWNGLPRADKPENRACTHAFFAMPIYTERFYASVSIVLVLSGLDKARQNTLWYYVNEAMALSHQWFIQWSTPPELFADINSRYKSVNLWSNAKPDWAWKVNLQDSGQYYNFHKHDKPVDETSYKFQNQRLPKSNGKRSFNFLVL